VLEDGVHLAGHPHARQHVPVVAEPLQAHRATAARALDGLRRHGAIRTGYGKITIVSPAQLREITGSQQDEAGDGLCEAPPRTRRTAAATGPAAGTWRENPEGSPARLADGQDVPLAWLENLLDGPEAHVVHDHGARSPALAMPGKNGGHGYPSGPSLQEELSPREQEIARLAADGWSNKAIAAELVISPATAARHVANIMLKLDFHSRSQIATWAVTTGLTASHRQA
jgi:DNA-binding CsgD family transcriptional regulator